jgi:hypothetical protein
VILAFRRPCADHRAVLLDWVDRRETGPATPAALAHLDRCRSCEDELAGISLALVALRRIQEEVEAVEPSPDTWLRLRARITRRADPWRWRATLGGLATSAMLVGVLVMPVTIGTPATGPQSTDLPAELAELRDEARYLAAIRAGSLPPAIPRAIRDGGSVPRIYPDEIAQVRKEVTSAKPSGRPPEPI